MSDEIPGMHGLCWSDLPLSDEEIEDLKMSGALDDLAEGEEDHDYAEGFAEPGEADW